jgi:pilus assembly protein CpaE
MILRLSIDAFTLTPAVSEVLEQLRGDRQLAKAKLTMHEGGLAAAVAHYAQAASPQVVIVEEDDDAAMLRRLDELAEVVEHGTRVVVVGELNDIKLYRTLLSRGVSDYLLRPVTAAQVTETLSSLFADPQAAPRGRVIACWGARGGAGSSTLAQNLAWSLGRQLQEGVVYADLDIAFGTSLLAFNIDAKQTVADALANPQRLDEVLMDRCMVDYDDHLQVLAAPGDCSRVAVIGIEALDLLLDMAGRMAAAVVVDLPHVWSDWSEHVLTVADEVVVTAGPDLASLRDTKALLEALAPRRGQSATAPRLVLNRMDAARKTQLTVKDFEDTLKVTPSLVIPFDPLLFGTAANNGQMLGEAAKGHKIVQSVNGFAVTLAGKAPSRKVAAKKGLLDWLRK